MNEVKINSRKRHTAEKLSTLPMCAEIEKEYKALRSDVFAKGLDIVQAHKASGICDVTYSDWEKCKTFYNDLCNCDWSAFNRVPKVVYKHLPDSVKKRVKVEE